ncbi:MAG TPA: hypothetical protein PKV93_11165 [Fervidobacterium sp.]|nr:hypothetical protein [Fervidobacterium sp.]
MGAKEKVLSVRLEKEVYDRFKKIRQEKDLPASLVARQVLKDWVRKQSSIKSAWKVKEAE